MDDYHVRCGCWNCKFLLVDVDDDGVEFSIYCVLDEDKPAQQVHSSGICSNWKLYEPQFYTPSKYFADYERGLDKKENLVRGGTDEI